MRDVLKFLGWGLLGLFVVYTFYILWQQSQPVPDVYELVKPEVRDIKKVTIATGKIDPRKKVEIKPQITGVITDLYVKAGDHVSEGKTVAKIKVITDMTQLNEAQTSIESASIQLKEIEREHNRTTSLHQRGVVSREEFERSETKLLSARETLTAAKARLEVATKGMSSRSGKINTTIVTSTMTGTVMSVPVKEGSSVSATSMFSAGTTICTVADMSDVLFKGTIDETDVDKLRTGMHINLILGAIQKKRIPAILEHISPEGVEKNGAIQFEVEAAASVPSGTVVRSGYSVNAEIVLDEVTQVLTVDEVAVELGEQTGYVYRLVSDSSDVKNQRFERVPVEIGISDGVYVRLVKGVAENDLLRGIKK